jgi:DNA-binding NtrC family response regulator
MPDLDGLQFLEKVKNLRPDTFVLMMTAYGSVETAVEAMKKGAYHYLSKPFEMDELIVQIEHIEELCRVTRENQQLRAQLKETQGDTFVGQSEAIQESMKLVDKVAKTDSTILITGETGTGKELLTQTIHNNSLRKDKPFIPVNCAVLSREIFESELFGYEKGAFTGAHATRQGRFELADGGTIYLDDVDDIPLDLQVKLLRVLQERQFERVGGGVPIEIDVRVIASTKADLRKLVEEGKFREDLYYRLNVFPIHLKPLRERREDIPVLVDYFIKNKFAKDVQVSQSVLDALQKYDWPGNVRELKNIVERLLLLAENGKIHASSLPAEILRSGSEQQSPELGNDSLDEMVRAFEKSLIQQALQQSDGIKAKAAELLKIPATTLRSKISKLGNEL